MLFLQTCLTYSGKNNNRIPSLRNYLYANYTHIQKEGFAWLTFCAANGVGTILADDMGLGKTAQVIALCRYSRTQSKGRILVVVPNPLLANWVREFAFFAPTLKPFLHYGPYRGS